MDVEVAQQQVLKSFVPSFRETLGRQVMTREAGLLNGQSDVTPWRRHMQHEASRHRLDGVVGGESDAHPMMPTS